MKTRKRFGQNFLHDQQVIKDIVAAIHPQKTDEMIEIGPGLGVLTEALLPQVLRYEAIEIDRDLIPLLLNKFSSSKNFILYSADVLTFDFSSLKRNQNLRVIGNLPYNISTPLLFYLLEYRDFITDMHFMLQKEVVDRIIAKPGTADYGRLSVMVQFFCETSKLFVVKKESFFPAPKVESAFIRLIPYHTPRYFCYDFKTFEHLVKQAFSQRRKTLKNSLKGVVNDWEALGIDSQSRPEQLSVEEFVSISNEVYLCLMR